MADPTEEFRWENLTLIDPDLSEYKVDNIDELSAKIENLDLNPVFTCEKCGAGYSKEGFSCDTWKQSMGKRRLTLAQFALNVAKSLQMHIILSIT